MLHPVAIHFKGSGFYSTDYGRGKKSRRRTATAESRLGTRRRLERRELLVLARATAAQQQSAKAAEA